MPFGGGRLPSSVPSSTEGSRPPAASSFLQVAEGAAQQPLQPPVTAIILNSQIVLEGDERADLSSAVWPKWGTDGVMTFTNSILMRGGEKEPYVKCTKAA